MAVTAKFDELELIIPRATVTEEPVDLSYHAAAAMYEALWDVVAPGGAAKIYQGHDHTPTGGGGPINRGCLWSINSNDFISNLIELSFTAKDQAIELVAPASPMDMTIIHASPGFQSNTLLTGWICYYARNSDKFTLEFSANGTAYDIDLPKSDGEKIRWFQFEVPLLSPGAWQDRHFFIRCEDYDSTSPPVVSVYALQLDEHPGMMERIGEPEFESPAASGNTIRVAFPTLEDTLVAADEWYDSYCLKILYENLNGLYEGTEEKRAPGSTSQVCRGHDHDASNYGGRTIARGNLYTASLADSANLYRIAYNIGTMTGTFYAWDNDEGANNRSGATVGMALYWCGPGINNTANPPTAPPYLTAYLYARWDVGGGTTPTIQIRAKHLASGSYSAVSSVAASAYDGWIVVDKIPCAGDVVNELQWEIEASNHPAPAHNFDLIAFMIYEVPGVGGRTDQSTLPALASGGG